MKARCQYCRGTGKLGFQREDCWFCGGSGYYEDLVKRETNVGNIEFISYKTQMLKMYSKLEEFAICKREIQDKCLEFERLGVWFTQEQYNELQKMKSDTNDLVDEVMKFLK